MVECSKLGRSRQATFKSKSITLLFFCLILREHGSIKKTPSEQAGIKLELGQNKIESLVKMASKKKNKYHPVN